MSTTGPEPSPTSTPPVALTIAGVDSGGGAGIAADLRTFAAHGVFGTLVVTALTAQDTTKVYGAQLVEPDFLCLQLDSVLGDLPVVAAKTGMLGSVRLIDALTERARAGSLPPLVVDPVMVATSGAALVEGDAPAAYRRLLAHASVATPNLPEAESLLEREIRSLSDMEDAARALVDLGVGLAVVKGGHLRGHESLDVCFDGTDLAVLVGEHVDTVNVHGTGCTLSAAITANLARGLSPLDAVAAAKRYVSQALRRSAGWHLGEGPGPLDHLGPLAP
ncbi:MAG: phosphomethylpyrimidine kinase [Acidimicrobiaceae bacterium]|nr:phosphomethylpyrimidine kinase [Acidimicrobiaceae bacterium]